MKHPFKIFALISFGVLSGHTLFAQDETDALRYSFLQPQGTARSIGIGSALGSVGGDFSSLSVNPAGIGIYRKSEFMFTPSLMLNNSSSGSDGGNGAHFSFSNVGVVWTSAARGRRYDRSPWKSVSFGFGINRMADFTRDVTYGGTNTNSSGSLVFQNDANNLHYDINPDNFSGNSLAYLGYQSYLFDTATLSGGFPGYLSNINPSATAPINQYTTIKERGGISELVFTLGGNYQEHLMLGATVGLPVVNYTRDKTFQESGLAAASGGYLNSFRYTENLRTSGLGVNLKLGAIYKPNDNFRIGAAVHTPSYIALSDVQDQQVESNVTGIGVVSVSATQNQYNYAITTPWRGVASATAILGKYGFVTADYEYVDYSSTRFTFDDVDADAERQINSNIRNTYQGASNIRLGAEARLDALALRAGFGYYGNPYKSSVSGDGEHYDLSAGIGFRSKRGAFVDFAFVHHQYKNNETPYTLPSNITADYRPVLSPVTSRQNNIAMTVGWKF